MEDLEQNAEGFGIDLKWFQPNIDEELVNEIQWANTEADGILLNAGAYTHTSTAMRDAISN